MKVSALRSAGGRWERGLGDRAHLHWVLHLHGQLLLLPARG